jgi:hypothetical protein
MYEANSAITPQQLINFKFSPAASRAGVSRLQTRKPPPGSRKSPAPVVENWQKRADQWKRGRISLTMSTKIAGRVNTRYPYPGLKKDVMSSIQTRNLFPLACIRLLEKTMRKSIIGEIFSKNREPRRNTEKEINWQRTRNP